METKRLAGLKLINNFYMSKTQELAHQRIEEYETIAQGLLHVSRNPERWK